NRHLGELQGVGRHRIVPAVRVGARRGARAPRVGAGAVSTSVADTLHARLAELQPSMLDIQDDSAQHAGHAGSEAGGRHFSVTIVSEYFLGLSRLARHRAV